MTSRKTMNRLWAKVRNAELTIFCAHCNAKVPAELEKCPFCGNDPARYATMTECTVTQCFPAEDYVQKVLKFYADPSNYVTASKGSAAQYDPEPPAVLTDGGAKARRALRGGNED